jgi:hypothetical protein
MSPHLWYRRTWFHGTDVDFSEWMIPPPAQPWWLPPKFRYEALFFTGDPAIAAGSGAGLCKAELRPDAKVLDATVASAESEALRQRLMADPVAKLSVHINEPGRWLQGWRTGEVLELRFADTAVAAHLAQLAMKSFRLGWSPDAAVTAVQYNATRGLIGLICVEARALGFDALAGHEVHTLGDVRQPAAPWLAVFNDRAITPVEWVTKPA